MARVKQWQHGDTLSYLIHDPISRRSALVDPEVSACERYLERIRQQGLCNHLILYTREQTLVPDLPGQLIMPHHADLPGRLVLGESVIHCLLLPETRQAIYYAYGFAFTGTTILPGSIDGDIEATGGLAFLWLRGLTDDFVLYPGCVNGGRRISSLSQELCASSASTFSGGRPMTAP